MRMGYKVLKTREGLLLSGSVPKEIADAAAVELFSLRDGIYLLSIKGALGISAEKEDERKGNEVLSEKEKALVRKLLAIRFEQRTPEEVGRATTKEEKAALDDLLKRKVVQVFHGGKYAKTGVYNISDAAFFAVREPQLIAAPPTAGKAVAAASLQQAQDAAPGVSSHLHLEKYGFMVLDTDSEARNFANACPEKVKSGEVMGIRAFDRKYYFVTRNFLQAWEKKVELCLGKSEKDETEIASEIGIPALGCRAVLFHLCESGEVMERKKGKFARA